MKPQLFALSLVFSLLWIGGPWPACAEDPASTKEPSLKAMQLLQSRCSTCHATPKPKSYTKPVWADYVERMAPRADLSEAEKSLLRNVWATSNTH